MSAVPPRPKRSLFSLIGDLPGLVMDLVRSEIEHLKQELITRIAQAGTGIALLAVGASVLFFALGAFVTAAILGLAEVLPAWASALIVGGGLVLLAVLKRGAQGPAESIDSIKQDVRAIKGIGRQD